MNCPHCGEAPHTADCAPTWRPPTPTTGVVDWTGWRLVKVRQGISKVRRRCNGNSFPWPYRVEWWVPA